MSTEIWIAVIAALGGGGIGAALISALFGRRKASAETEAISIATLINSLKETDEHIARLWQTIDVITAREAVLEEDVVKLKDKLRGRDLEIDQLTKENQALKKRVDELVAENLTKDREIAKLKAEIAELREELETWRKNDHPGIAC